jgi:hypothetical protein
VWQKDWGSILKGPEGTGSFVFRAEWFLQAQVRVRAPADLIQAGSSSTFVMAFTSQFFVKLSRFFSRSAGLSPSCTAAADIGNMRS